MADLVTSIAAAFIGGIYGRMWLGRVGLVGGVTIGLSLGYLYPLSEETAEGETAEAVRRRRRITGRRW